MDDIKRSSRQGGQSIVADSKSKPKAKRKAVSISLRRQITLTFLGLFTALQVVLMGVNYFTSRATVADQINSDLDQSITTFKRIIGDQLRDLNTQSSLLAKDFGFKQAIATGDNATIQSALQNIQTRANIDLSFVLNLEGDVMAAVKNGSASGAPKDLDIDSILDLAEGGADTPYFLVQDGQLYEMSILPIRAPILMGVMVFGKALGDSQAALIQSYSAQNLGVAFLYKSQSGDWQVSGQSATNDFAPFFARSIKGMIQTDNDREIAYKGETFSVRPLPLEGSNGSNRDRYLLLFVSLDKAMSRYTPIFITLFAVGIIGMGMMFIGGYFIADRISAPIRLLAEGAANIAKGTYHPLSIRGTFREVNNLRDSFNSMTTAVQEREDKIVFQASHDTETGLPNSQYLTTLLSKAIEEQKNFAMVVAEIRDFHDLRTVLDYEQINDIAGQVGQRLQKITGTSVARLSSDSFGLMIENPDLAQTLMKGIIEAFLAPFMVSEIKVDLNLVIGFACAPEDGKTPVDLILAAHSALDEARLGGHDFLRYSGESQTAQAQHLSLMSDLRSELTEGHVTFNYQPKLDIKHNKLIGAEALIRWNSPKHGFVPPDKFIELAEKTGDIRALTAWGLEQILCQAKEFKAAGIDLMMSANLSTRDLQNEALPDLVRMLMTDHDIDPAHICLEVTESAVMGDTKRALSILNNLSDMGIYLSIDDYGTGYSSLSYIKSLPVDELKIDKAFVLKLASSSEDQILVQSTIDLAHNLGMKVTAEGVEDDQSLQLLKSYGCDVAQGYFISRPVPAADFEHFWKDYNG